MKVHDTQDVDLRPEVRMLKTDVVEILVYAMR